MALQSPVDYLRKKEDSILPDDDTSNAEFLDPQDLSSQDENTYGSQGGGMGSEASDDDGMQAGRTIAAKSAFAGPAPRSTAPSSPALDPAAYNAASQKVADIAGQRPGAPKPKWWQRLAAGAVGGLAGFSNAEGKAGPQINPAGAEDALLGGPQSRRQLSDWQRQVDAAGAQQAAEAGKLSAAEKIQRVNAEAEMRKAQKDAADYRLEREKRLDNAQPGLIHSPNYIYDPVTKKMVWQNTPAQPKSPATYEAYLVAQLQSPDPKIRADAQQKLDALKAKAEPHRNASVDDAILHPDEYDEDTVATAKQMEARRHPGRQDPTEKPAPHSQFRLIEDEKQRDLQKAEMNARKRISGDANNDPEDPQTVAGDLASDKQRIQNAYEAKIEAAGGHAQHVDLNAPPAQAPPPQPQQTQPAPQQWQYKGQTITEGQAVMVDGKPRRVIGFKNGRPQVSP